MTDAKLITFNTDGTPNIDWVLLLAERGDSVERTAVAQARLGEIFPKYAEFWGRFVYPNRDPEDPMRLRSGFDEKYERIFNSHYGVFYQITTALLQLKNLNNPLLDIATPIYHLGAAADLVERTFLAAYEAADKLSIQPLTKVEYDEKCENYWSETYESAFREFTEKYVPVSVNLHITGKLVGMYITNEAFKKASRKLRDYRNALIHGLPPLRLSRDGVTYIPNLKHLKHYRHALWSSKREDINIEHYAPTEEVIAALASELIASVNDLWDVLIHLVGAMLPPDSRQIIEVIVGDNFDHILPLLSQAQMGQASGVVYVPPSPQNSGTGVPFTRYDGGTLTVDWMKPSSFHSDDSDKPDTQPPNDPF
jgi:hypothetical protein